MSGRSTRRRSKTARALAAEEQAEEERNDRKASTVNSTSKKRRSSAAPPPPPSSASKKTPIVKPKYLSEANNGPSSAPSSRSSSRAASPASSSAATASTRSSGTALRRSSRRASTANSSKRTSGANTPVSRASRSSSVASNGARSGGGIPKLKLKGRLGGGQSSSGGRGYNPSAVNYKDSEYHYGSDFEDEDEDEEAEAAESDKTSDESEDDLDDDDSDDLDPESDVDLDADLGPADGAAVVDDSQSQTPVPFWLRDDEEIPPIVLPESSEDLLIPNQHVLRVFSVYEVLRRYQQILRLTPFRIEDFCAAIASEEQSNLLSEVHMSLLRTLVRSEEQGANFGPMDTKDSVASVFFFMDSVTWPESLRMFFQSDPKAYAEPLAVISGCQYPFAASAEAMMKARVDILSFLADQILSTTVVRDFITDDGRLPTEEHCRVCHRLGEMLVCDNCPGVYHLGCLEPPLHEVPQDEWRCYVCAANEVQGVFDCEQANGNACRQDCLGTDRAGNKYWFLCRRLVVESADGSPARYYSTVKQLEELSEALDDEKYEFALWDAMEGVRVEMERQMDVTEAITKSKKAISKKSYFEVVDAAIFKLQADREEKEAKRLEEEKTRIQDDLEKMASSQSAEAKPSSSSANGADDDDSPKRKEREERMRKREENRGDCFPDMKEGEEDKKEQQANGGDANDGAKGDSKAEAQQSISALVKNELAKADLRMTRRTVQDLSAGTLLFKLGQEGTYRTYVNQYTSVPSALSKQQSQEERQKKTTMSHKFSLTDASAFKWVGSLHGSRSMLINTLRQTMMQLEGNLPSMFMHTNWNLLRKPWIGAVGSSETPRDFARALTVLQCCMKPCMMLQVWNESLGHTQLKKITTQQREEKKKAEKRERKEKEEEDERLRPFMAHVKYTLGLKHQVHKQKGEEYRAHGQHGWLWLSSTRSFRPTDANKQGLRAGPYRLAVRYSDIRDGTHKIVLMEPKAFGYLVSKQDELDEKKKKEEEEEGEGQGGEKKEEAMEVDEVKKTEDGEDKKAEKAKEEKKEPEKEPTTTAAADENDPNVKLKMERSRLEEALQNARLERQVEPKEMSEDVVDISAGLSNPTRVMFPKVARKSKVLDEFLARRQQLKTLEERRIELRPTTTSKPQEVATGDSGGKASTSSPAVASAAASSQQSEGGTGGKISKKNSSSDESEVVDVEGESESRTSITTSQQSAISSQPTEKDAKVNTFVIMAKRQLWALVSGLRSVKMPDPKPEQQQTQDPREPEPTQEANSSDSKEEKMEEGVPATKEPESSEGKSEPEKQKVESDPTPPVQSADQTEERKAEGVEKVEENKVDVEASLEDSEEKAAKKKEEALPAAAPEAEASSTPAAEPQPNPEVKREEDDPTPASGGSADLTCYSYLCRRGEKTTRCYSPTCQRGRGKKADEAPSSPVDAAEVEGAAREEKMEVKEEEGEKGPPEELSTTAEEKEKSEASSEKKDEVVTSADTVASRDDVTSENKVKEEEEAGSTNDKVESSEQKAEEEESKTAVAEDAVKEEKVEQKMLGTADPPPTVPAEAAAAKVELPPIFAQAEELHFKTVTEARQLGLDVVKLEEKATFCSREEAIAQLQELVKQLMTKKEEYDRYSSMGISTVTTTTSQTTTTTEKVTKVNGAVDSVVVTTSSIVSQSQTVTTASSETSKSATTTTAAGIAADGAGKVTSVAAGSAATKSEKKQEEEEDGVVRVYSSSDTTRKLYLKRIQSVADTKKNNKVVKYPLAPHFYARTRQKRNILLLSRHNLKHLARKYGIVAADGYNYNCKNNGQVWPYPCPRPLFKTTWLYRTACMDNLQAVGMQLRVLWASVRWDDMHVRPLSVDGKHQTNTESAVSTTEILKHRNRGRFLERTQYFKKTVAIPLDVPKTVVEVTPIRSGLRKRKRAESPQSSEPKLKEEWVDEDKLELWEIRAYREKLERDRNAAITRSRTGVSVKEPQRLDPSSEIVTTRRGDTIKIKVEDSNAATPSRFTGFKSSTAASAPGVAKATVTGAAASTIIRKVTNPDGTVTLVRGAGPAVGVPGARPIAPQGALPGVSPRPVIQQQVYQPPPKKVFISKDGKIIGAQVVPSTHQPNKVAIPANPLATPAAQIQNASASPSALASPQQKVQIVRSTDGKIQVRGLLAGQQLVQMPDGKLQILTSQNSPAPTGASLVATGPSAGPPPIQIASSSAVTSTSAAMPIPKVATPTVVTTVPQQQSPAAMLVSTPGGAGATAPKVIPSPQLVAPAVAGPSSASSPSTASPSAPKQIVAQQLPPGAQIPPGMTAFMQGGKTYCIPKASAALARQQLQQQQQVLAKQQQPQQQPIAPNTAAAAASPAQQQKQMVEVKTLGANTVSFKGQQMIVSGPDVAQAQLIAKQLSTGQARLGTLNGKQVLISTPAVAPVVANVQQPQPQQQASPMPGNAVLPSQPVPVGQVLPATQMPQQPAPQQQPQPQQQQQQQAQPQPSPKPVEDNKPLQVTAQLLQTPQGPRIVLQGIQGSNLPKDDLAVIQQQVKHQLLSAQAEAKTQGRVPPTKIVIDLPPSIQAKLQQQQQQIKAAAAKTASGGTSPGMASPGQQMVQQQQSPSTPQKQAPMLVVSQAGAGPKVVGVVPQSPVQQQTTKLLSNLTPTKVPPVRSPAMPEIVQKVVQDAKAASTTSPVKETSPVATATAAGATTPSADSPTTPIANVLASLNPLPQAPQQPAAAAPAVSTVAAPQPVAVSLPTSPLAPSPNTTLANATPVSAPSSAAEERRRVAMKKRLQSMLVKQTEGLKKDIGKKRTLREKELQIDVREEVDQIRRGRMEQGEDAAVVTGAGANSTGASPPPLPTANHKTAVSPAASSQLSPPPVANNSVPPSAVGKRTRQESGASSAAVGNNAVNSNSTRGHGGTGPNSTITPPSKRKRHSSGGQSQQQQQQSASAVAAGLVKKNKTYCICKTKYDPTKFYVGCDICSGWFHGSCVGISEAMARDMSEYICEECQSAKDNREIYCLCKQPYDESQFYIGCERCSDWFHGRCVGILQSEAENIDEYLCPNCEPDSRLNLPNMKALRSVDYEQIKRLLKQLQGNRNSWPFKQPVDRNDAPNYYIVVKEPMDLQTVETRLNDGRYTRLCEFVGDVVKIFENCRLFNRPESQIAKCSEALEGFFAQKLGLLRERVAAGR